MQILLLGLIAFGWSLNFVASSLSIQCSKGLTNVWLRGGRRGSLPLRWVHPILLRRSGGDDGPRNIARRMLQLVSFRGGASTGMDETVGQDGRDYQCILAVGSNMGDRYENIVKALDLLFAADHLQDDHGDGDQQQVVVCRSGRVSFLYETAPMYITDQPKFLNGAVEVYTSLEPHDLLSRLKAIEARLGRDFNTVRNGPRPIDLDILLYRQMGTAAASNDHQEYVTVASPDLTVPHPRIAERDFVLAPLIDLLGPHATLSSATTTGNTAHVVTLRESLELLSIGANPSVIRVVPIPRGRLLRFDRTLVMGILNVTPDSFSDGGHWATVQAAVQRGLEMVREGADIIDIGGESTRPGAVPVPIEEELRRTIPVIQGIREGKLVLAIVMYDDTTSAARYHGQHYR
jgi:2-amino-4-hydroxy-6-hydroxymethyldihydropteridine diphosphokinase